MSHLMPPPFRISHTLVILFAAALTALSLYVPATWAQTAHSPETFLDCKQIDFGPNTFDRNGRCCLPSEQTCSKCFYRKSFCENVNGCDTRTVPDSRGQCCLRAEQVCGKCNYTMNYCEERLNRCGLPAQPNRCGDCTHQDTCCQAYHPNEICVHLREAPTLDGNIYKIVTDTYPGYYDATSPACLGGTDGLRLCVWLRCTENCPGGHPNVGCFDPRSTILLEGGHFKSADEIRVGDRLYNSLTGSSAAVKSVISGDEKIPMVEMGFGGNLLKVTQGHPVITKEGVKRARDISVGDVVLDASGREHAVEYSRLAELIPGQRVFNFELDIDSSDPLQRIIVADNIASGDLTIQNSVLPGEE